MLKLQINTFIKDYLQNHHRFHSVVASFCEFDNSYCEVYITKKRKGRLLIYRKYEQTMLLLLAKPRHAETKIKWRRHGAITK